MSQNRGLPCTFVPPPHLCKAPAASCPHVLVQPPQLGPQGQAGDRLLTLLPLQNSQACHLSRVSLTINSISLEIWQSPGDTVSWRVRAVNICVTTVGHPQLQGTCLGLLAKRSVREPNRKGVPGMGRG